MRVFLKLGRSIGLSDFISSPNSAFFLDFQCGLFGPEAPTDAGFAVSEREPEQFETIVKRYVRSRSHEEARYDCHGGVECTWCVTRGHLGTLGPNGRRCQPAWMTRSLNQLLKANFVVAGSAKRSYFLAATGR